MAAALLPLLEPEMSETGRLVETRLLASALKKEELPLDDVINRIMQKNPQAQQMLLVADHFEELYTLCPEATRRRFVDALLETLDKQQFKSEPDLAFVLALRADFLVPVLGYRPFADALQDATLILGPMTRDELGQAITKPAEKQGVFFGSGPGRADPGRCWRRAGQPASAGIRPDDLVGATSRSTAHSRRLRKQRPGGRGVGPPRRRSF